MKEEVKSMIPTIFIPGRQEALRSYREAIYSAGGVPICSLSAADSALCGGLLLPGGGDIGERLDEPERKLIQSFVQSGRPILGICRGMQALNVYFGGDLIQDIGSSHSMTQGRDRLHPTRTRPGSQLHTLYGAAPVTNSGHHQVIGRLAEGWQATQWALDGVVEAIECQHLPMLGVQWHPERLHPAGDTLLQWFVRRCAGQVL